MPEYAEAKGSLFIQENLPEKEEKDVTVQKPKGQRRHNEKKRRKGKASAEK